MEVRVGWSNIPADWELIVELARSETDEGDQTRLADDARRTVSGSGEMIFKLGGVWSVEKFAPVQLLREMKKVEIVA